VHQLEHALSGEYDFVAHGAGLAVLFPAWSKFALKENPERFAQFARRVFDVADTDDLSAAVKGVEEMEKFFKYIGMPLSLREFNIPETCIDRLADLCTYGKTRVVKSLVTLDFEKIKEIYKSCY
jgi:alcohol dehydrogenase YqhD (iron-dependent ADH family)